MQHNLIENPHYRSYLHTPFTVVDQVRLWLAQNDLEQAMHWAMAHRGEMQPLSPFACEREEVALVRVNLSQHKPVEALTRLGPLLQKAAANERWGHIIEMLILQALAYQVSLQEDQALAALAHVVRLAEPEGYIRIFVDEGACMATLLSRLQRQFRKQGSTPYLDRVLAAFPPASLEEGLAERPAPRCLPQQDLLDPLSVHELEVLRLMAQGATNQEIARALTLAIETVKRHVSNILSKLGACNRTQAVMRAHSLGLLSDEP